MWRSFFTAVGICLVILGVEALVVDRVTLNSTEKTANQGLFATSKAKEVIPPDWAPWSFLSSGAITILYSATLRKEGGK